MRAEFSHQTRRVLAARAGHRCSAPDCNQTTTGPGAGPYDVDDIGTASHIFAATPGGPRGTGGLSEHQRRDIANGIWLCATHGRLVDGNDGGLYPAALLQGWRSLHEARTRLALKGARANFGWIEFLRVTNAPVVGDYQMVLSSHNLIIGRNAGGKTMLLNLLASGSNPESLEGFTYRDRTVEVELRWHDPDPRLLKIVADAVATNFVLDGQAVPFVSTPYQVFKFSKEWGRCGASSNPRAYLPGWPAAPMLYGMYERSFVNTLKAAQELSGGSIQDAEIGESGVVRIAAVRRGGTQWIELGSPAISAAESVTLDLDICLAIAVARARDKVTLLAFDGLMSMFDGDSRGRIFERLTEREWPFQIVVTSVDEESAANVDAMWLVTHLRPRHEVEMYSVDQER